MTTTPCRFCGKPVVWVRLPSGKKMTLDPRPTPRGRWLIEGENHDLTARFLSWEEYDALGGTWRHRAHATACEGTRNGGQMMLVTE